MSKIDTREAVARFTGAVANLSGELLTAGVEPHALAAGLRIEAGKIELAHRPKDMQADERELTDLARKAHEYINTMQVAGIDEATIVTVLAHACVERVARQRGGPAAASNWLRGLADFVDTNPAAIATTSRHH